jgi:hypothetical protein
MLGDTTGPYNGYSNAETFFLIVEEIDNHKPTQNFWLEMARDITKTASNIKQVKQKIWTEPQAIKFELADLLKNSFEGQVDRWETFNGFPNFMKTAFRLYLERVSWNEVASHILEGVSQ